MLCYGHVRRASCINQVSNLVIPGPRGRGRLRKTWSECVKNDLSAHNLIDVNPLDRESWYRKIKDSLVLSTLGQWQHPKHQNWMVR